MKLAESGDRIPGDELSSLPEELGMVAGSTLASWTARMWRDFKTCGAGNGTR